MSAVAAIVAAPPRVSEATTEPAWVRRGLIAVALAFLTLFLFVPLVAVFAEALKKGVAVYLAAIVEPDALAAIRLTLVAAAISVPLNCAFGVAAAWAIAKFDFRGKNLLLTLIDLPFSVSPVISGLVFVLRKAFSGRGLQVTTSACCSRCPALRWRRCSCRFPSSRAR